MPAVEPKEASGLITGSEQILKDYAKSASLTAKDVKKLIKDVLHNPEFNADDVDTDMLEQFAKSIDSGDLEIISMHKEGDGAQKLELFKRLAEKVLRELMSDIRLAGCQHFAFKEYMDPKVPVSLVIYIDATYIKKGIPIRPIYCKSLQYRIRYRI